MAKKSYENSLNKYMANVDVDIPDSYFEKWQKTVDLMATIFEVPAGLIMRIFPTEIEVFVTSHTEHNPYEKAEKATLNAGLYCETVLATREQLEVPNALEDVEWKDNPDVKLDMISYLGVPLMWPNNEMFGTICVLDSKTRHFSKLYQALLWQFKEIIDGDLKLLVSERQLAQHAEELSKTLADLKATQDELVQSEKMAALGHLIAGIAHEINTPLGAIGSSITNILEFCDTHFKQLPVFFKNLSEERESDFLLLLDHIAESKPTLSRREKRALKKTFTQWLEDNQVANASDIADLLVIMGIQRTVDDILPLLHSSDSSTILDMAYQLAVVHNGARSIDIATNRAAKIVFALKNYVRNDQSGEKTQANLVEGLETVLTLYHNYLKQGIEIVKHYDEVPDIQCYPDELNQVWTNLIHNALQAMNYKGTLTLSVKQADTEIVVSVTDNGQGIDESTLPKIFTPFFTTKPAGEGSGLGLDIVKKIVDKHNGKIDVTSQPGETTFTVTLPLNA